MKRLRKTVPILLVLMMILSPLSFSVVNAEETAAPKAVFLGGSITAGSGVPSADVETKSYRAIVSKWLSQPENGGYECINAALGGRASNTGLTYLNTDVLSHNPKLVFIEYAVNDTSLSVSDSQFCMEQIVREILAKCPGAKIVFLYTSYKANLGVDGDLTKSGTRAATHQEVADFYGIPSIDLQKALRDAVAEGNSVDTYFGDSVHPSVSGHALYAETIIENLSKTDFYTNCVLTDNTLSGFDGKSGIYTPAQSLRNSDDPEAEIVGDWKNQSDIALRFTYGDIPTGNEYLKFSFEGNVLSLLLNATKEGAQLEYDIDNGDRKGVIDLTKHGAAAGKHSELFIRDLKDGKHICKLTRLTTTNGVAKDNPAYYTGVYGWYTVPEGGYQNDIKNITKVGESGSVEGVFGDRQHSVVYEKDGKKYLYMTGTSNNSIAQEIDIFDITDPTNVTALENKISTATGKMNVNLPGAIAIYKDMLYVLTPDKIYQYSLEDPENPQYKNFYYSYTNKSDMQFYSKDGKDYMIVLDYTQSSGDSKKVGKLGYYELDKDVGYLDANNVKRGNQPSFNHYLNKSDTAESTTDKGWVVTAFCIKGDYLYTVSYDQWNNYDGSYLNVYSLKDGDENHPLGDEIPEVSRNINYIAKDGTPYKPNCLRILVSDSAVILGDQSITVGNSSPYEMRKPLILVDTRSMKPADERTADADFAALDDPSATPINYAMLGLDNGVAVTDGVVKNNMLYASFHNGNGFRAVDISNPMNPQIMYTEFGNQYLRTSVAMSGDYVFTNTNGTVTNDDGTKTQTSMIHSYKTLNIQAKSLPEQILIEGPSVLKTNSDGSKAVSLKLKNNKAETETVMPILACMKNGELTHIIFGTQQTVSAGESITENGLTIPASVEYDTVKVYVWRDTNTIMPLIPAIEFVNDASKKKYSIACWGDSLTYGQGSKDPETESYPAVLQSLNGSKVYNMGVCGETAMTIAARQGGTDLVLTEAVTIPESGETEIKFAAKDTTGALASVVPRDITCGGWNPVSINGIEGTLTVDVNADRTLNWAKFTRTGTGNRTTILPETKININAHEIAKDADINIIFIGTNGGWNAANTANNNDLIALIKQMIENTKNKNKFIVIGLTRNNTDDYTELNNLMKTEFGEHFLDAKSYLSSEQALKDMNLPITENDSEYIQAGNVAYSFMSSPEKDPVHMNTYGYKALAKCLNDKLNELGYLK